MQDLGGRIQELRKKNGLTQVELAKRIGISHPQMVRYENKNVQPPADVLAKIAIAFGVSTDYLVFGETSDRAQQTLKDAELIKLFESVEKLPNDDKTTILKVVAAFVRDTNAKQAYKII